MTLNDLRDRVRAMTRDQTNRVFTELDFRMYFDEAIDRLGEVMPEFEGIKYLRGGENEPELLPRQYHYLLANYCASRCFAQDERFFQSAELMNEFEMKLDALNHKVISNEVQIKDKDGNIVIRDFNDEYVHID